MSAAVFDILAGPFANSATLAYKGRIVDIAGNPVPGVSLTSLVLTLTDTLTGEVVNGVDKVNVLNTDRGLVDDEGRVTITLGPADTEILNPFDLSRQRSIILQWTYNSGSTKGRHEARFWLKRLGAQSAIIPPPV